MSKGLSLSKWKSTFGVAYDETLYRYSDYLPPDGVVLDNVPALFANVLQCTAIFLLLKALSREDRSHRECLSPLLVYPGCAPLVYDGVQWIGWLALVVDAVIFFRSTKCVAKKGSRRQSGPYTS